MKFRLITLLISQALLFAPAYAGQELPAAPVKFIQYYEGHTGMLVRQDLMVDPDACGRTDYYILRKEHPHYKELTALLLSSHLTGQSLGFYVSGCHQGIPSIVHVTSIK